MSASPLPQPADWTITEVPVGDPDAHALLHTYTDELASRYLGRPATHDEIAAHVGDGADVTPPHGEFLLARAAGAPVGCVGLRRLGDGVGELTRVFVRVEARRGGAGARLVGAAEDFARSHGIRRMLLNTRSDLTEALALYHRLGYRPTEPYGDDPYAEVWLARDL